jgi:dTDP-4-amino-4,6-dideoxygalactose transaminase
VTLPQTDKGNVHVYNQFTVRAQKRDELRAYLKDKGVGTEIYYPIPLHLQQCFRGLGYKKGDFPVSERAAEEVMSLPIYAELTEDQQAYVVRTIAEFYRHA